MRWMLTLGLLASAGSVIPHARAAQGPPPAQACASDPSPHQVRFVTVEPGVVLEVLDWGGSGEPLLLLTGLGDNAHVFDDVALRFTDRFHVIGLTRRGFGRSSQPAHGYDLATRSRDVIRVLDQLAIPRAIVVGHSVAGTELNRLAADHPDRVRKLVYLDALDLGWGGWRRLPQPPPPPDDSPADLASLQRFAAASARSDGYRKPLAALCNMLRLDASGRVVGAVTPPEVSQKILEGLQPADLQRIQAPVLGIFNRITPDYRLPYVGALDPAGQKAFISSIGALSAWIQAAISHFRSDVPHARVIELENTNHYLFIVDEELVVREMRRFLLSD